MRKIFIIIIMLRINVVVVNIKIINISYNIIIIIIIYSHFLISDPLLYYLHFGTLFYHTDRQLFVIN